MKEDGGKVPGTYYLALYTCGTSISVIRHCRPLPMVHCRPWRRLGKGFSCPIRSKKWCTWFHYILTCQSMGKGTHACLELTDSLLPFVSQEQIVSGAYLTVLFTTGCTNLTLSSISLNSIHFQRGGAGWRGKRGKRGGRDDPL